MFKTTTEDLMALSEWLATEGCTCIAMEATGIHEKRMGRFRAIVRLRCF